MAAPVIQSSFSAGELSPHLFGRVDLNKYKIGLAKMKNFIVDYKGGAAKRAGTKFVGYAGWAWSDIVFIPFTFSSSQTYLLEMGHGYTRFITNGGYVLDASGNIYQIGTFYPTHELKYLKWTQSGDTITITHPRFQPIEIVRFGHANWVFRGFSIGDQTNPMVQGVWLSAVSTGSIDAASAAYVNYGYAVTSVGPDGAESRLSGIARLDNVLDMAVHRVTMTIYWNQVTGTQYFNVYKATVGVNAQISNGTRMGFLGSTTNTSFTDTNILPNYTKGPPIHNDPFTPGQIKEVIISNGGYGYSHYPDMQIFDYTGQGGGAYFWGAVTFSSILNAHRLYGGGGYVAPWVYIGPPNLGDPSGQQAAAYPILGPTTGTYPGAVAYYQQRLLFAGSTNDPATIWGSKPGAFHNFDTSIPLNDGDSFEFTLASQQLNAIKYMIPMPGGLVILTSGGAWQLSGTQQFAPVTPTQVMATPQAFNGCGDLQPIVIGYEILFIQSAGSVVRNLSYNFFANIYTGADITVLSSHLFNNHTIKSWAYAEEPDKVIWCVRDDGILLSMTFLKEQEVAGWAQHQTAGKVLAVGSVREGNKDVIYIAVERSLPNGVRHVFIEQMQPRSDRTIEKSWFLDCALTTTGGKGWARLTSGSLADKENVDFSVDNVTLGYFHAGWIGGHIFAAGGKFRIHSVLSTAVVRTKQIVAAVDTYIFEETRTEFINPQEPGDWEYHWIYNAVAGLSHLEGCTVSVYGDGKMQSDKIVRNGTIQLDTSAAIVIVGLGYDAEIQTLRLESQPTIQTRMKKLPHLTVRVADTRGLWAGTSFKTLTEIKDLAPSVISGEPASLHSGDLDLVLDPLWSEEGQICIRSVNGLPANIIAVIPEAVIGDD